MWVLLSAFTVHGLDFAFSYVRARFAVPFKESRHGHLRNHGVP